MNVKICGTDVTPAPLHLIAEAAIISHFFHLFITFASLN